MLQSECIYAGSVQLLLAKVLDNLLETLVGAGKEAQQRQYKNDQILQTDPYAGSLVRFAACDQLDDGRKYQGQSRRAECAN